jgi:simple sugar transport system permease protein
MNQQKLSLLATLSVALLLFLGASLRYSGFFSAAVFFNLFDDNAFLGIAAVGMTFVILSGGIDLSVGAMIGLTSILTGVLVGHAHFHPLLAALLLLVFGALFGALMGVLIAKFEIAPFLVTLAGLFFARGLAYTISLESIPLTHPFYAWFGHLNIQLAGGTLHSTSILFLLIVVAGYFITSSTQFGRSVYAIGGNSQSAELMGLQVKRTQILIYSLSGLLSALAGITFTLYTSSGNATAAVGLELDVIAAVVIGGTLLSGGRGSVWGTLLGVLILGMIQTIITFQATLSSWWTRIMIGLLLLFFVILQTLGQNLLRRFGKIHKDLQSFRRV